MPHGWRRKRRPGRCRTSPGPRPVVVASSNRNASSPAALTPLGATPIGVHVPVRERVGVLSKVADLCDSHRRKLGRGFTRLVAQSARRADDRVIDRAAMGPERIGPDIFQSSPVMRRGARHRYVSF